MSWVLLGFFVAVTHKAVAAQGWFASVYIGSGETHHGAVACGTVVALVLHLCIVNRYWHK